MGSLFSPSYKKVKQPFETNPWKPSQPHIMNALDAGKQAYDQASSVKDPVADLTGTQHGALAGLANSGQYAYQGHGDQLRSTGFDYLDIAGQADDHALETYNAAMNPNRFANAAQTAAQQAENPYLKSNFNSAVDDIYRQFGMERAGINSGATGTGNINSTRAGVQEGLAQEGAMRSAMDVASNMYGNAYETNLDRALATQSDSINQGLAAAGFQGQLGQMGSNLIGQGLGLQSTGWEQMLKSGTVQQAQNQASIDGRLNNGFNVASNYMDLAARNFGNYGYQTSVDKQQSPFQTLLGGAATIAGLF